MRLPRDRGMTLLEVMLAISILLIGVGFIVKSDSVMYHYRNQREVRQQMLFYAAGQLERVLQNQPLIQGSVYVNSPFNNFAVSPISPGSVIEHLESIGVTVSVPGIVDPRDNVTLYTYRVK